MRFESAYEDMRLTMKLKYLQFTVAVLLAVLFLTPGFAQSSGGDAAQTKQLIEVLKSDKGVFEKAKACQRLAVVGTVDAVPVLANLLGDAKLAHYARFGLEPMPYEAVDEALRGALGKLDGNLRIGVINSIGARGDAKSQDALISLFGSRDKNLTAAAAAAVARIGTPKGAHALRLLVTSRGKEIGIRLGEAAIVCAEQLDKAGQSAEAVKTFASVRNSGLAAHIRAAALRGEALAQGEGGIDLLLKTIRGDDRVLLKVAFGAARELPGRSVTNALVSAIDGLPAAKQVQVLNALADRGDKAALSEVQKLAADEAAGTTQIAAIRALRYLGDASVVPSLLRAAGSENSDVSSAAFATLAEMGDDDVDGAALALLDIALNRGTGERGSAFVRTMVIVVGSRKMASSVRLLRQAAERDDSSVRLAAIQSLGTTIGLDDFGALIDRLAAARGEEETAAIRSALSMASRRMPSPAECSKALASAMREATPSARAALLGVFSAVGSEEALAVVTQSAGAAESPVRHAALAALGNWPHQSAVFKLLEIIPKLETADRPKAYGAFRSIVTRIGFDRNRRLGACVDAMKLATNDDERKIAIGAMEGIPAPKTLNILKVHLKNEALGETAASAMVKISERLVRTRQRKAVAPAMKSVLSATKNDDLIRRAKSLSKQIGGN
ncbi:MAG: HEAT repeat domain-containing protein [Planctomycetota bacterium]